MFVKLLLKLSKVFIFSYASFTLSDSSKLPSSNPNSSGKFFNLESVRVKSFFFSYSLTISRASCIVIRCLITRSGAPGAIVLLVLWPVGVPGGVFIIYTYSSYFLKNTNVLFLTKEQLPIINRKYILQHIMNK